jgi:deazaflavin-dependent oxidoreductase (nitroreductase family)
MPRSYAAVRTAARVLNPLVLSLAGTRLLPLYGVIEHHGRRSGKAYRTPVVVRPTNDGFVVPMPWGEHTDWYRNVRAVGECVLRWRGRDYFYDRLAGPVGGEQGSPRHGCPSLHPATGAIYQVRVVARVRTGCAGKS